MPSAGEEAEMNPHPERIRPLPGSITIDREGDQRVLCLRGELDTAVAERFKDHQGRDPMIVDVIDAGAVSFISSTALALLVRCAEASLAAGRRPVLRASSPSVERILQLSGLSGTLARPPTTPGRAETPG
jgi:anti-anti-sigma factor